MDSPKVQSSFEDAVMLVYHEFPRMGDEKGQLYDEWTKCNALLQHVISLKDCFRELHDSDETVKAPWQFCDLLRECQRYVSASQHGKSLLQRLTMLDISTNRTRLTISKTCARSTLAPLEL